MVVIKCLNCGKEMKVYPSSKKKFCSVKCRAEYAAKQTRYIEIKCKQCGKVFKKPERAVKAAKKKGSPIQFCSKECHAAYWGRNRVEQICPVCGKKFLVQKKWQGPNKCCSPECSAKNPANPMLPKETVEFTCEYCGKKFTKLKSFVEKTYRRGQKIVFCSKKCANLAQFGTVSAEYENRKCKQCGKEFKVNKKSSQMFCDENCRLEWTKRNTKTVKCKQCDKEFEINGYRIEHGRKYCSKECWNEARCVEKDTYSKLQHYLRSCEQYKEWHKNVMSKACYKCEECGSTEHLNVHHKNQELYSIAKKYDFDIDKIIASNEFNDVNNGQCLCLECHIKKHPYHKELRNKKGQFCRREFKAMRRLTIKRTELSGKTDEKAATRTEGVTN